MSSYIYKLDQAINDVIYIGTSGLVNGDFTRNLYRNGAAASETITISEIGSTGYYKVTFTPSSGTGGIGEYVYWVFRTSDTENKFFEIFNVRAELLDATDGAAIKAKTDQLTFTGSDVRATLDGETVTVATNNDKTGYALSAAGVDAILDEPISGHTTAGTLGDYINRIKKYVRNKLSLSAESSGTYTVYEDDGTTPHETGTFSTTTRIPS